MYSRKYVSNPNFKSRFYLLNVDDSQEKFNISYKF